jgi:hypothetical protein
MAISMSTTMTGVNQLAAAMKSLNTSVKRGIQRKILAAVASKYVSEIKKRTPRSRITGTSEGWSAATRERRAGIKDALRRSLNKNPSSKWSSAGRLRSQGVLGITVRHLYPGARGAKGKPIGPHAHLVESGHDAVFWGHEGGRVEAQPYFWEGVRIAQPQVKAIVKQKSRILIAKARAKAAAAGGRG